MRDSKTTPLPAWARVLDALCLLLVLLAVTIFVWGGFRERVLGIRIAITSPFRMFLWAVGLGLVRHYFAPQRPVWADLPARLRAASRTHEWRTAFMAVAGTRPAVLFVGYMALFLVGFAPQQPAWRISDNEFLNLQARWDAGWYYGIATEGYYFSHGMKARGEQQNIVFFPAMPLLMRVSGRLLGGAAPAMFIGGTIVSWVAFLTALVYLFRFARDLLGDDARAAAAVWLVATYPFAVWFGAVYTESLYLLGAVAALYHFKNGAIWKGGAWGLLVGLTRPNGCFLSVPLALLALRPWLPHWLSGGPEHPSGEDAAPAPGIVMAIAAASLPGIGMLIYSAYVWSLTGNPLSWAEGHVAWGRSYQGLSILVAERYKFLSEAGVYAYTSQATDDVLQVAGVLFVLLPAWFVARRFGLAYAVFILINILPPLAAGGVLSAGRFSSVLFPAFIWAAGAIKAEHRPAWYGTFMAVQALNAILFYTWRPMF
jgi:hypothetical protein